MLQKKTDQGIEKTKVIKVQKIQKGRRTAKTQSENTENVHCTRKQENIK